MADSSSPIWVGRRWYPPRYTRDAFFRRLVTRQDEAEVADTRLADFLSSGARDLPLGAFRIWARALAR